MSVSVSLQVSRHQVYPTEFRERLVRLALDGISSPSTLRAYSAAIDEFLTWAPYQPLTEFSKALVQQYKSMLIEKGLAPSTINQRLAAVRRLTTEAADNGLLDPAGCSRDLPSAWPKELWCATRQLAR